MVHLDDYSLLANYRLYEMKIPDSSLLELDPDSLPEDWDSDPAPLSTAQIGDEWLISLASTALYVPSTIVPMVTNILINPTHQQYPEILKTVTEVDFRADPRL